MRMPELYKLLPIEDKIELLMYQGHFLGSLETFDYETWLYNFNGQYAEIIYSIPFNRIEDVRIMEFSHQLDRYLDEIDISDVVN